MPPYSDIRKAADEVWRNIDEPKRPLLRVSLATCSVVVGAQDLLEALRQALASGRIEADIVITGDWGLCYAEPTVVVQLPGQPAVMYQRLTVADVPRLIEEVITKGGVLQDRVLGVLGDEAWQGILPLNSLEVMRPQVRRLMANCGIIDPENIDHYIARGGYEGLNKALTMDGEAVDKEVLDSGLWGRGGAAFPTGRKWEFLRGAKRTPKYMICNADEGDPGSFVNRNVMESDPQLLVEGMAIAGYATGASYGFIYIREEYPLAFQRMEKAVQQARERGCLGKNIFGSDFSYDLEVIRGAGAYTCGEETGLIASLDDSRGMPKIRPPFPAEAGVFGQPSNVNNVESFANAPLILRHGAQWWASEGSEQNKGTKMFSLSGQINRVCILEVPLGVPMRTLVMDIGGGLPEGRTLKGVQAGGPLSGVLPARDLDISLEPQLFRERAMFLGSGGLVILDDTNCIVDLCVWHEWFAEAESCGRCTNCFTGTRRLVEILRRIARGGGRPADVGIIRMLGGEMGYNNNCAHGQAAPTVLNAVLSFFEEEFLEHLQGRRCRARVCRGLVRYEVVHHSDKLPAAEAICPTTAVVPSNGSYAIDQRKCIKCDACRQQAPYAIALLDEFGA